MELGEYFDSRGAMVEEGLHDFIHNRYEDDMLEMAAHVAVGGKRLRGIMALMCCEAVHGEPARAVTAACAVELAHAASLVKDDVMDNDETRRGTMSFWKRFGLNAALLVPDVILPHAVLFTSQYGGRSFISIVEAWGKIAQGQLMDSPKSRALGIVSYEHIISKKTAPLFEVACELGVRAARMDHLVSLGKQYGFNAGMAFQVYDDYCDLLKARGKPWEACASGDLPNSLRALKAQLDGGELITEEDCASTLTMAEQYLRATEITVGLFPETEVKPLLEQLPRFCCNALIMEVQGAA